MKQNVSSETIMASVCLCVCVCLFVCFCFLAYQRGWSCMSIPLPCGWKIYSIMLGKGTNVLESSAEEKKSILRRGH